MNNKRDFTQSVRTHGWFLQSVPKSPHGPFSYTIGLQTNFNHPDFQIVIPVDMKIACEWVHTVVNYFKTKSVNIQPNQVYEDIFSVPCIFIPVPEKVRQKYSMKGGPNYLRLILADKRGFITKEEMDPLFATQYDM